MAISTLLQGFVGRALPTVQSQDGANALANIRLDQRGNTYANLRIPTKHVLCDEGTYFTANNAQTGIATGATPTAFSATNPFITIANQASASVPGAPRIYLDYVTLLATAAGTAGASVQVAVYVDNIIRYTSGGTALTPVKTNSAGLASVAQVYAGNITAAAAGGQVRAIVGNRYLKGAIPVAGDTYTMQAGSVDSTTSFGVSTILFSLQNMPPVIVNPGETALVHLWLPSQSAASSYAPELSWWEF
jgi:hypothetical protein